MIASDTTGSCVGPAFPDGFAASGLGGALGMLAARHGPIEEQARLSIHPHILFWLVHRTASPSEANRTFESVSWDHKVTPNLPLKRKVSSEWQSSALPAILQWPAVILHPRYHHKLVFR